MGARRLAALRLALASFLLNLAAAPLAACQGGLCPGTGPGLPAGRLSVARQLLGNASSESDRARPGPANSIWMRFGAVGSELRFGYPVWWLEFVGEMVGVDAV